MPRVASHGAARCGMIGAVLDLLRCTHLTPSLAVTAIATALALAGGRGWGALWVAGAVLAGQFSVGWANDWLDHARDVAVGRRDKPVARGRVPVARVRSAAWWALVACALLSLASGVRAASVHLLAVGLGWAYDLGLKRGLASVVPYAVAFAMLPVFVALGLPRGGAPPVAFVVAGALLGAGAHFTNAVADLADDARTGVRGLPQRVGARASLLTGAVLLGCGGLVVTFGAGTAPGPARLAVLAVALLLVALVVALGLRGHRRAAFPLSLAAAATVVAGFVTAGGALA